MPAPSAVPADEGKPPRLHEPWKVTMALVAIVVFALGMWGLQIVAS